MKIDPACAYVPFETVSSPSALAELAAPPRSWKPAEPSLEALPGWWVSAGYWDRDAVEGWFARPN
jgi:hypothetical protein